MNKNKFMKYFFAKFVFIALIIAGITACGVKSYPVAMDGVKYPAQYPPPLAPIRIKPRAIKQHNQAAPVVPDLNNFWQYPNTPPTQ
jgi:hypothetical protein|tara:strand:- start:491 stop:748 length:258 start_codon:yes stop_codon:yes gene_type:complete